MAFLDKTGITTLVNKLKEYFALKSEIPTVPDLTPQVLSVTDASPSTVTISTNRIVQSGNVVSVMTEITLTAAQSNFTTIITGLPPTATGIAHIWTEVSWATSYQRPLRCQVTSAGAMQIRYGAATTYRLTTTYICAS